MSYLESDSVSTGRATAPLCRIMVCGHDIPAESYSYALQIIAAQGCNVVPNEQYLFGDWSHPKMHGWRDTARAHRMKTVQVLGEVEEEDVDTAIYSHILWEVCRKSHMPMQGPSVFVVSVPRHHSGACSIFSVMCEKLRDLSIPLFSIGTEECATDVLSDVTQHFAVPLHAERLHPTLPSAIGAAPSSMAFADINFEDILQERHTGYGLGPTRPSQSPIAPPGSFFQAEPVSRVDEGDATHDAVSLEWESKSSAAPQRSTATDTNVSAASMTCSTSTTSEQAKVNMQHLTKFVVKRVESAGGPPYVSVHDAVEMAKTFVLSSYPNRAPAASDFGEFETFGEAIGAMRELIVGPPDLVDSMMRTTPVFFRVLKSGCYDDLVVRSATKAPASPAKLEPTVSRTPLAAHPPSNFKKYTPLDTSTNFRYFPFASALYHAIICSRSQVVSATEHRPPDSVALSKVISFLLTHYPLPQYQFRSYGFSKASAMIEAMPELFTLTDGPGNLPVIRSTPAAPRRLAWMQEKYEAEKQQPAPSMSVSKWLETGSTPSVPLTSPKKLMEARQMLVRAIKSLAQESPTGGSEGFLPSLVVQRASLLTGKPFDPKAYGHPRLKPLILLLSDKIEWFTKGPVDYVRLVEPHRDATVLGEPAPPRAARTDSTPAPVPHGRVSYKSALVELPPAYGTESKELNSKGLSRACEDARSDCSDSSDSSTSGVAWIKN